MACNLIAAVLSGFSISIPTQRYKFESLPILSQVDFMRRHELAMFLAYIVYEVYDPRISTPLFTFVYIVIQKLDGRVHCSYSSAVHGTVENALSKFYYVDVAPTDSGEEYVLMLRDNHSSYRLLFVCPETSAKLAARAIINWFAAFGVLTKLMLDGPTYLKNGTVRLVAKILHISPHFALPFSPWSNIGTEWLKTNSSIFSVLLSYKYFLTMAKGRLTALTSTVPSKILLCRCVISFSPSKQWPA